MSERFRGQSVEKSNKTEKSAEVKTLRDRLFNKWIVLFTTLAVLVGREVSSTEVSQGISEENLPDDKESLVEVDHALNVLGEAILEKNHRVKSMQNHELEMKKIARLIQREEGWKGESSSVDEELIDLATLKQKSKEVEELAVDQWAKETYQKIFDALPDDTFKLSVKEYGKEEFVISNPEDEFEAELIVEHEDPDEQYELGQVAGNETFTLIVKLEGKNQSFNVDSLPQFSKILSHVHDLHGLWNQYKDGMLTQEQYELNKESIKNK